MGNVGFGHATTGVHGADTDSGFQERNLDQSQAAKRSSPWPCGL